MRNSEDDHPNYNLMKKLTPNYLPKLKDSVNVIFMESLPSLKRDDKKD